MIHIRRWRGPRYGAAGPKGPRPHLRGTEVSRATGSAAPSRGRSPAPHLAGLKSRATPRGRPALHLASRGHTSRVEGRTKFAATSCWCSEKPAPCGSRQFTTQSPPGTSIGPFITWPPRLHPLGRVVDVRHQYIRNGGAGPSRPADDHHAAAETLALRETRGTSPSGGCRTACTLRSRTDPCRTGGPLAFVVKSSCHDTVAQPGLDAVVAVAAWCGFEQREGAPWGSNIVRILPTFGILIKRRERPASDGADGRFSRGADVHPQWAESSTPPRGLASRRRPRLPLHASRCRKSARPTVQGASGAHPTMSIEGLGGLDVGGQQFGTRAPVPTPRHRPCQAPLELHGGGGAR